ncbi:unnamed protein product [Chilo suppressalis]|uniref:Autophagy-related protein 16 domain-containing protein n=1 Tax=Chilo suppressalis TaxID=168631 RepID=A0ABN8AYM4_CHISP|nr:unnamed protein product [Chilo suppressalis]
MHTLTGHSGKVMAAKFLGEPTKVITGSHDRTLKIWDLRSTETKFAGSSCNDLVTSDGAGSTIISGHYDKRIRFWDIRSDVSANDIMLQGRITSLDLSRDSNYLLACVRDDTIQLIDLRMNTIVRSFSHESFKVGCDWSRAAFGPGGRLLSVGGGDGAVYVWNTYSGRLEAILKDHTSNLISAREIMTLKYLTYADCTHSPRHPGTGRDQPVLSSRPLAPRFYGGHNEYATPMFPRVYNRARRRLRPMSAAGRLCHKAMRTLHKSAVAAVSWHPQSGLLASVDRGKRAVIWGDL